MEVGKCMPDLEVVQRTGIMNPNCYIVPERPSSSCLISCCILFEEASMPPFLHFPKLRIYHPAHFVLHSLLTNLSLHPSQFAELRSCIPTIPLGILNPMALYPGISLVCSRYDSKAVRLAKTPTAAGIIEREWLAMPFQFFLFFFLLC